MENRWPKGMVLLEPILNQDRWRESLLATEKLEYETK
jgi:hypothetical protein